jgi:hypothetical protein
MRTWLTPENGWKGGLNHDVLDHATALLRLIQIGHKYDSQRQRKLPALSNSSQNDTLDALVVPLKAFEVELRRMSSKFCIPTFQYKVGAVYAFFRSPLLKMRRDELCDIQIRSTCTLGTFLSIDLQYSAAAYRRVNLLAF